MPLRRLVGWAVVAIACGLLTGRVLATPAALTEVQRLKAEKLRLEETVLQLQVQVTQCQVQQASANLTRSRGELEAEFRATLNPPDGAVFDWTTLTFRPATQKGSVP